MMETRVHLAGDRLMSLPRDLRLERLSEKDGWRNPYLGEVAQVGAPVASASSASAFQSSYEALIDAVFMAPGAREWLSGLRRAFAAFLADKDRAPRASTSSDAIRT
jgi:hypothetical protein